MSEHEERERFLEAIRADRYDQHLRWVFADWLEEHGFDDEAALQRAWTREKQEAEDWLRRYAADLSKEADEDGYGGFEITYEELIAKATVFFEADDKEAWRSWLYLPYVAPRFVYETQEEFWRRFKVLTGRDVPEGYDHGFIGCAC